MMMVKAEEGSPMIMDELFTANEEENDVFIDLDSFWRVMETPTEPSQDDKVDVILKYMPDEARLLKAYGELPKNTRFNEGIAGGLDEEDDSPGDDYIEFEWWCFLV